MLSAIHYRGYTSGEPESCASDAWEAPMPSLSRWSLGPLAHLFDFGQHRSHFGSRYPLGLMRSAQAFCTTSGCTPILLLPES